MYEPVEIPVCVTRLGCAFPQRDTAPCVWQRNSSASTHNHCLCIALFDTLPPPTVFALLNPYHLFDSLHCMVNGANTMGVRVRVLCMCNNTNTYCICHKANTLCVYLTMQIQWLCTCICVYTHTQYWIVKGTHACNLAVLLNTQWACLTMQMQWSYVCVNTPPHTMYVY